MLKSENLKKMELNHNICWNRYICLSIELNMWDVISKRDLTFKDSRRMWVWHRVCLCAYWTRTAFWLCGHLDTRESIAYFKEKLPSVWASLPSLFLSLQRSYYELLVDQWTVSSGRSRITLCLKHTGEAEYCHQEDWEKQWWEEWVRQ